MNLIISPTILAKLQAKHGVALREVEQCFTNREGALLIDNREQNKTIPPTQWFIAHTHAGRLLKVCFIMNKGKVYLKTAYEPNQTEIALYAQLAGL